MADTQQFEENPPFAMFDNHAPQHMFETSPSIAPAASKEPSAQSSTTIKTKLLMGLGDGSHMSSSNSPAPGLVESVMTDGSSTSPSGCDSDYLPPGSSLCTNSPSKFLTSSLPTVSSEVGGSSLLPSSRVFGQHEVDGVVSGNGSYGFSQLLRAADDANIRLGNSRMPMVPEHDTIDESSNTMMHSGTLISPPQTNETEQTNQHETNRWLPSFLSRGTPRPQGGGLRAPLLTQPAEKRLNQSVLGASPHDISLAQAKTTINSVLEDDQSFEVSMDIQSDLSVQDVMNVLGNPDLLKLWCDPIQTLIVTSSSDETRVSSAPPSEANRGREYEGEWIEATTTALESPPSAAGFLFGAGQSVMHTLGFASYGRITMFVERRRGQVGLTVGPFQGGIHASHTINVVEENGVVRLVDRVRLAYEEHEPTMAGMFLCGALGSCLSSCLLPPLGSYVEQVKTSMGRLRLLVENENRSPGGAIITGGTLVSVPVR